MRRRILRRLIWVYTVCSGLSVRIHMVNTVAYHWNKSVYSMSGRQCGSTSDTPFSHYLRYQEKLFFIAYAKKQAKIWWNTFFMLSYIWNKKEYSWNIFNYPKGNKGYHIYPKYLDFSTLRPNFLPFFPLISCHFSQSRGAFGNCSFSRHKCLPVCGPRELK